MRGGYGSDAGSGHHASSRDHPPYDPEVAAAVADGAVDGHPLRPDDIPRLRSINEQWHPSRDDLSLGGAVHPEERHVAGLPGRPGVDVLMLWPTTPFTERRPALLACHGGGMVGGNRYGASPGLAGWVAQLGVVVISVEYRLAPEHPYPAPLDDVAAVLAWLHADSFGLGIDPGRLGVFGISAGACLAAAACLRGRDERGPVPAFAVLQDPMLDDRLERPSTYEHVGSGVWDRISAETAWDAYLGGWHESGRPVPPYAAPARARDLRGLPPTFIDVGSADLFRDEAVDYATRLLQAGVPTELHVWPGGWHGFSEMVPEATISQAANEVRTRFIARMIAR